MHRAAAVEDQAAGGDRLGGVGVGRVGGERVVARLEQRPVPSRISTRAGRALNSAVRLPSLKGESVIRWCRVSMVMVRGRRMPGRPRQSQNGPSTSTVAVS